MAGANRIVDSDVLIWALRGNARAITALQTNVDWCISAVSYMEVVQGCRNKAELTAMQRAFKVASSDVLPITATINDLGCALVEKYALSHNLTLADALIAATALTHTLPILTGNGKHFSVVEGLNVKIFRP
jgi:predicted nucleic acid-binding protein